MTDSIEQLEARLATMTAQGEASEARVDLIHALSDALLPRTPERITALNEEALALSERLGYKDGIAFSLNWIGFCQYMGARYEAALQTMRKALSRFEETGNLKGQAYSYTGLVYIEQTLGNHDKALAAGLRAIPLYEASPVRERWHGWNQMALGNTYLELHEYDRALSMTRQSLALFEEMGYAQGQARALTHLAAIYQRLERHREALPYLERSLPLFRQIEDHLGTSRTLNDLGCVYQQLGALEEALAFLTESLEMRETLGNEQARCTSLVNLGRLYLERQEREQAIALLQQALDIADAIKARPKAYQAHESLAAAYEQRGDLARALHHYKAFHDLKEVVVGEETRSRFNHLQISYAVTKAENEAEIERLKNVELEGLLRELKATQAQLIHAEKMASLGALTAGIAHEIKNPLNFVNNFALLSTELTDELADEFDARADQTIAEARPDLEDLLADLRLNAQKIHEHGRRADGIVRAMMDHAQDSKGKRRAVEIQALLEEYVNLAYHGKRATTPDFDVTIERSYDEAVGAVELVPQEIGRVVLNLLSNAFDAVAARAASVNGQYAPTVSVSTRQVDGQVEIRVADNGPGIPAALREKIFEPFFTTKPTGQGTGLGLSLSYDIVTQGHGGTLTVKSEEGEGTTFIVALPVN